MSGEDGGPAYQGEVASTHDPGTYQPPDDLDLRDPYPEEPPDGWQPGTPQFEAGYGVETMPGIDPIPADQRNEAGYSVDVIPTDLVHFSQMLGLDTQYFSQSRTDALNEMAPGYPNLAGVSIDGIQSRSGELRSEPVAGTYMPEGWSFQQTYFKSYGMLQQSLNDTLGGLLFLTLGAQIIHQQYQTADFFSLGGRTGGFNEDGYHVDLVNNTFLPPEQQTQQRDDALAEQAQQEWDDTLQAEEENGQETSAANDQPLLISDADPRQTETRHEGQPGEYTAPRDQQNVEWFDQADEYTATAPTGDDADPDDITVFHPETRERWHNV